MGEWKAASRTYQECRHLSKDSQIDLLRAQLAERDAEAELMLCQWGHSMQCLNSTVDTAQQCLKVARGCES